MHPWMLQQVAEEHRRDLLGQADRWRRFHRQAPTSSGRVQAASWRSRLRFNRLHTEAPSTSPAVPAPASATWVG